MARSDCRSSKRLTSQLRKDQLVLNVQVAAAIKDALAEIVQAVTKAAAQAVAEIAVVLRAVVRVVAVVQAAASIEAVAAVAALTSSKAELDLLLSKIKYLGSLKIVKSGFRP